MQVLSECDLLLGEFSRVLLWDVQGIELSQLLLFNGFDLATLFVDLLADLASLLKVVQAVLLGLLVVVLNLRTELVRMLLEDLLLFLLDVSLLFFNLLLLRDDTEELVTLLLGLL